MLKKEAMHIYNLADEDEAEIICSIVDQQLGKERAEFMAKVSKNNDELDADEWDFKLKVRQKKGLLAQLREKGISSQKLFLCLSAFSASIYTEKRDGVPQWLSKACVMTASYCMGIELAHQQKFKNIKFENEASLMQYFTLSKVDVLKVLKIIFVCSPHTKSKEVIIKRACALGMGYVDSDNKRRQKYSKLNSTSTSNRERASVNDLVFVDGSSDSESEDDDDDEEKTDSNHNDHHSSPHDIFKAHCASVINELVEEGYDGEDVKEAMCGLIETGIINEASGKYLIRDALSNLV